MNREANKMATLNQKPSEEELHHLLEQLAQWSGRSLCLEQTLGPDGCQDRHGLLQSRYQFVLERAFTVISGGKLLLLGPSPTLTEFRLDSMHTLAVTAEKICWVEPLDCGWSRGTSLTLWDFSHS